MSVRRTASAARARHLELELHLARQPGDDEAWQVYADWLSAQGDRRGELIAFALTRGAGAEGTGPTVDAHQRRAWAGHELARIHDELGDEVLALRWRWGFIVAAEIRASALLDDSLADLLGAVLRSPASRFLRALALTWVSVRSRDTIHIPLADLLAAGPLPALRALALGVPGERGRFLDAVDASVLGLELRDPRGRVDDGGEREGRPPTTRVLIGDLSRLWAALPGLEWIELRGRKLGLGALDHPRLRVLRIGSDQLATSTIAELGRARLPALEELSLDFGRLHRSRAGELELLTPVLAGEVAPDIRRLRLRSSEFGVGLVQTLLASPLLAKLDVLDLAGGDLSDDAAELFTEQAPRLGHLRHLGLGGTLISRARVDELRRALPGIVDFGVLDG